MEMNLFHYIAFPVNHQAMPAESDMNPPMELSRYVKYASPPVPPYPAKGLPVLEIKIRTGHLNRYTARIPFINFYLYYYGSYHLPILLINSQPIHQYNRVIIEIIRHQGNLHAHCVLSGNVRAEINGLFIIMDIR